MMSWSLSIKYIVIPAKAGIPPCDNTNADGWIPAFAGMTISVGP
jgi:hypothetical protein